MRKLIDNMDFSHENEPQYYRDNSLKFVPTDEKKVREMIAHRLHHARVAENMSIYALSRASGISDKQIQRIEHLDPKHQDYDPNYTIMPSMTTIIRLCNALRVKPAVIVVDWEELRYWEDEPPY